MALTISSVTVSGSGFALVSQTCTTRSIAANSFCGVTISFTPPSAGALAGTVTVVSNDPQTPQLTVALTGTGDAIYPVPTLSSLIAPTVLVNTATTETLTGLNFYPQSVAQLNGTALTTKFVSNTTLQATIPTGAITTLGEQILTVVNPQPAGGISAGLIVTPYQTIAITPSFLVSVPATGLLYAATSSTATSNPNTIIAIDPTTGTMKTPIAVGNKPSILAASGDGSYLYVANQTDLTVQRINLSTNAVERTFPYTPNLYCSTCTNVPASDLATVPGNSQQVLLAQGDWLTLYNDSGAVNHIPNDGICCTADPDFASIALAGSPLTVYGLPFLISGKFFQTANLTPSGLSYTRLSETNYGGNTTTGNQVISDGTLLYTSAGQIWNPATQTQIGTFPVTTYNSTSYPDTHNITLDTSLGEFYNIGQQQVGSSSACVITAYGLKSHAIDATLNFSQITSAEQYNLVRWGTNGFAFISDAGVYLVKTSAVSGSTQNPPPVLNSISPASVTAGGSSFAITVNGSSFLSSSVIDWNGTPLATSFCQRPAAHSHGSCLKLFSGGYCAGCCLFARTRRRKLRFRGVYNQRCVAGCIVISILFGLRQHHPDALKQCAAGSAYQYRKRVACHQRDRSHGRLLGNKCLRSKSGGPDFLHDYGPLHSLCHRFADGHTYRYRQRFHYPTDSDTDRNRRACSDYGHLARWINDEQREQWKYSHIRPRYRRRHWLFGYGETYLHGSSAVCYMQYSSIHGDDHARKRHRLHRDRLHRADYGCEIFYSRTSPLQDYASLRFSLLEYSRAGKGASRSLDALACSRACRLSLSPAALPEAPGTTDPHRSTARPPAPTISQSVHLWAQQSQLRFSC